MGIPREGYTELQKEVALAVDSIGKVLAIGAFSIDDNGGTQRTLSRYTRIVDWFGGAARDAGSVGIEAVCGRLREHLQDLSAQQRPLGPNERQLLANWPALLTGFVAAPADTCTRHALVTQLCDAAWVRPVSGEDASAIEHMLAGTPSAVGDWARIEPGDDSIG